MQTEGHKTVTIVEVTFSEDEWTRLRQQILGSGGAPASQYIHSIVMRSLKRKQRTKKGRVQP